MKKSVRITLSLFLLVVLKIRLGSYLINRASAAAAEEASKQPRQARQPATDKKSGQPNEKQNKGTTAWPGCMYIEGSSLVVALSLWCLDLPSMLVWRAFCVRLGVLRKRICFAPPPRSSPPPSLPPLSLLPLSPHAGLPSSSPTLPLFIYLYLSPS